MRKSQDSQKTLELSAPGIEEFLKLNRDRCINYLKQYFYDFQPRYKDRPKDCDGKKIPVGFTGAHFENYSARADPTIFDGNNLAAVTCLSVNITGNMASSLMYLNIEFSPLIAKLPDIDVPIWKVSKDEFAKGRSLRLLHDKLLRIDGIGPVITSKLLASKRPHLVPIQDRDVSALFGKRAADLWWSPWYDTMQSSKVRELLDNFAKEAGVNGPSLLRIADIIFWMKAQENKPKPC